MLFLPVLLGALLGSTFPAMSQDASLDVDLGYGIYRGYHNDSTGLDAWRGIRYAAPPIRSPRWQAPTAPEPAEGVIQADEFGSSCPQAAPYLPMAALCSYLGMKTVYSETYIPPRLRRRRTRSQCSSPSMVEGTVLGTQRRTCRTLWRLTRARSLLSPCNTG